MKISHWLIAATFVAPLFACSSSDDEGEADAGGGDTGGTGGSVNTGGTGGGGTGGSGGSTGGSGGSTGGTGGTGGTECTIGSGNSTCDACIAAACATECQTAMDVPAIQDILDCYKACGTDNPCLAQCDVKYKEASDALDVLDICAEAKCATECAAPSACTLGFKNDPTCNACLQPKCETECVAAMADKDLSSYLTCSQACKDAGCYDACDLQYPSAATAFGVFSGCIDNKCGAECADCPLTFDNPPCDACVLSKCRTQCVTAQDEQTLSTYLKCVNECTDKPCEDACDTQYPAAVAAIAPFYQCLDTQCATECPKTP